MNKPMWERPLVYVAGPYTNPDPVRNTHDAVMWAEQLIATGKACPVVPHITLLWHAIAPHDDVDYWYDLDLGHLRKCDAVFRFPGKSSGADAEVEWADRWGIPVFTEWAEMVSWLDERA